MIKINLEIFLKCFFYYCYINEVYFDKNKVMKYCKEFYYFIFYIILYFLVLFYKKCCDVIIICII